jgi:hypothetical protein
VSCEAHDRVIPYHPPNLCGFTPPGRGRRACGAADFPGALSSAELARWDQVHRRRGEAGADPAHAFRDLLVSGVRAAVVAPERELPRWFSWPWYWTDTLVDELVGDGRLRRVDGHVTVAG